VQRSRRIVLLWLCLCCFSVLSNGGCGQPQSSTSGPALPSGPSEAELRAALTVYADIAQAGYADSARAARELISAIDALLAEPSAQHLEAARARWLAARVPYTQTEVLRFYDGPIDAIELLVNTWPIDEAYVEGEGDGPPGILDDVAHYPELTRELLSQLNLRDGETSVSTGYHVIEFLLWGKDDRADGPGDRSYTDYVRRSPSDNQSVTYRRGRYLKLSAELLAEQLDALTTAWSDAPDSYRRGFVAAPAQTALSRILKGMGSLSGGELAGERLTVAYETKNQENEHSCFSDSTHLDLANNALGIHNVCIGHYHKLDGTELKGLGVCELIGRYRADLGSKLTDQIAQSLQVMRAIPAPFDTAILGNDSTPARRAVAAAISALQAQTQTLSEAAAALSLAAPATREAHR